MEEDHIDTEGYNNSTYTSIPVGRMVTLATVQMILAVVINAVVLVVIHRQRELQDIMRTLYQGVMSLNITLGILWNTWSIFWFALNNPASCAITSRVFPFLFSVTVMAIMFCLCGVNLNLYLLVTRPLRYHMLVTATRLRMAVILSSAMTIAFCGVHLPFPGWPFNDIYYEECIRSVIIIGEDWNGRLKMWLTLIPIVVMLVFTTTIQVTLLRIARKKRRSVADIPIRVVYQDGARIEGVNNSSDKHSGRHRIPLAQNWWSLAQHRKQSACCQMHFDILIRSVNRLHRDAKGLITVALVTGTFFVTWLPFTITFATTGYNLSLDKLAVSYAWIQPLVYIATNGEARMLCRKLVIRWHWLKMIFK